jgi:hypothetical protein
MKHIAIPSRQRGATLVVGLIMLVLITLMVTTAFMLSSTNLKAVGNMQFRDGAVAAANYAIEQAMTSPFATTLPKNPFDVDLNDDGVTDYSVTIAAPACLRAVREPGASAPGTASSVTLGIPPSVVFYQTVWDIDATVQDAVTGASVRMRQGFRLRLDQSQCNATACAPCA